MNLKHSVIDVDEDPNKHYQIDQNESKKDHRGKPVKKVFTKLGGLRFYECPVGWITFETNSIINVLTLEEKPAKIYPGTWVDQPHWYIQAKQLYSQAKNKWQLEAQKA